MPHSMLRKNKKSEIREITLLKIFEKYILLILKNVISLISAFLFRSSLSMLCSKFANFGKQPLLTIVVKAENIEMHKNVWSSELKRRELLQNRQVLMPWNVQRDLGTIFYALVQLHLCTILILLVLLKSRLSFNQETSTRVIYRGEVIACRSWPK